MSNKGNSPDNAGCEGVFGRIKNECFYNNDFKGYSLKKFKNYLDKYKHRYNNERIKLNLGEWVLYNTGYLIHKKPVKDFIRIHILV